MTFPFSLTVATLRSELDQVTRSSHSPQSRYVDSPAEKKVMSVLFSFSSVGPTGSVSAGSVSSGSVTSGWVSVGTVVSSGSVTWKSQWTLHWALALPQETVMVAWPGATAVMSPSPVTVATVGLSEVKERVSPVFWGSRVTCSRWVPPGVEMVTSASARTFVQAVLSPVDSVESLPPRWGRRKR